ncbi:hypothetical protein [Streptomyces sp. KL2]|uniref:hypothetical protein n=1 Tax=Streptomyces sp. KL2 TaxID=3050126 RepID=UPI00397A33F5
MDSALPPRPSHDDEERRTSPADAAPGAGLGTRATVTAYGPGGTVLARNDATGPLR